MVGALDVGLEVAPLGEGGAAVATDVGLVPAVLLQVYTQRVLLVEGLLADLAHEWALPCQADMQHCQPQNSSSSFSFFLCPVNHKIVVVACFFYALSTTKQ